jgi:hypothetical protein
MRPKHALALHLLYETQLAPILDQPDLGKGSQSGQRIINLLDLPGRQDLQRLVQDQCKGSITLHGSLSLSRSAVPLNWGILSPPRTKKPTHTPDQACESASGYFSPLSRQSRFVRLPWVKQTILFLRCLQDALALHFLDEAQLATLFDESDLTKGP